MIPEEYIAALKRFVNEETSLIAKYGAVMRIKAYKVVNSETLAAQGYNGLKEYERYKLYYENMYRFVSNHSDNYILFKDSNINFFEIEFAESVSKIREKLISLCNRNNIPYEGIFIPKYKIADKQWDSIIHVKVAELIRDIYDNEQDEEFNTLRLFNIINSTHPVIRWINSKNGKNFLFEFQVSEGVKKESLIKKRLYLFDDSFEYAQMQYMSREFWMHDVVIDAFEKWESDNTLWKNIDHLKRKINSKEILDESRPEIKFLRLLENNGYKDQFIHDEYISWQVKFRPDYWFINHNLIVEYDETAHKFQEEQDRQREKIIRKYLPNIHFIRVTEGYETEGLLKIKEHLEKKNGI